MTTSDHFNVKSSSEIVDIAKASSRQVYDIEVADDPHLFALHSGVLTHNSNPMPESVTDRPTKSHEHLFLFAKQARYYYDAGAIAEPASSDKSNPRPFGAIHQEGTLRNDIGNLWVDKDTRNKRDASLTPSQSPCFRTHLSMY